MTQLSHHNPKLYGVRTGEFTEISKAGEWQHYSIKISGYKDIDIYYGSSTSIRKYHLSYARCLLTNQFKLKCFPSFFITTVTGSIHDFSMLSSNRKNVYTLLFQTIERGFKVELNDTIVKNIDFSKIYENMTSKDSIHSFYNRLWSTGKGAIGFCNNINVGSISILYGRLNNLTAIYNGINVYKVHKSMIPTMVYFEN